jgi:hypothetical protein
MYKYLICLLLLITPAALADEFKLIELDELRVDYIDFFPSGRDPLITHNGLTNRELGKLLNVEIKTTLLKYGYWRSLVNSMTDAYSDTHRDGQFRLVGLQMELGLRVAPFLDVYGWHHSQHLLDHPSTAIGGFPVQDGIGIRLYIFSKDRKDSLLDFLK